MNPLRQELTKLASLHSLVAVYAFGSRAGEAAARVRDEPVPAGHPDADLDLGVQVGRGRRLDVRRKVALSQAFEALFQVPRVDLVVCEEAPAFLAQEIVSGELLCCTDPDAQAEFELYALRRAGDLAPFAFERRRMILEEGAL
jgi:hypothetical protein